MPTIINLLAVVFLACLKQNKDIHYILLNYSESLKTFQKYLYINE